MTERKPTRTPLGEALHVALPYLILGCLWIFLTDRMIGIFSDPSQALLLSNLKGWLFVFFTSVYIVVLIKRREIKVRDHQEHLEASEARFRLLVESAPDAVFVQTDSRFAYVNKKTVEIFGVKSEEELIGKYIPDFLVGEFRKKVENDIKNINEHKLPVVFSEETILRRNGGYMDVEVKAVPIAYNKRDGALVFMRDITERRRYEQRKGEIEVRLREKQKLESIGTLAGGVAHEINNPINGIINYAQLIQDEEDANPKIVEYSEEIMREGQRVADIVKSLLSFARQEKQIQSPAQMNDIVGRTVALVGSVLRHDQIDFQISVPDDLPRVVCCAQQIQQVLLNLITNARYALNARYKGYDANKQMSLGCSAFEKDGHDWVRIEVKDNGGGIDKEILSKVFDPFFTTKPRDEGTGLGLSISHGIILDHHGDIYFKSEPGQTTQAIVELPVEGIALTDRAKSVGEG